LDLKERLKLTSRGRRLVVWFFCTLIAAVVPLGFIFADLRQKNEAHGLANVLSSGELILISGVLVLGSFGELFGEKAEDRDRATDAELGILIATMLLLASTGWLYPVVKSSGGTVAVAWSFVALTVSFVVGASSIWVSPRYRKGER
jgi:hypothetical protein